MAHLFDLWLLAKLSRYPVGRAASMTRRPRHRSSSSWGKFTLTRDFPAELLIAASTRCGWVEFTFDGRPRSHSALRAQRLPWLSRPARVRPDRSVRGHTREVDDSYLHLGPTEHGKRWIAALWWSLRQVKSTVIRTAQAGPVTLCVPNKGNQVSNDRMERYWSDRAVDS